MLLASKDLIMCVKLAHDKPLSIFLRETADYLQVQDNPYLENDMPSTSNGSAELV